MGSTGPLFSGRTPLDACLAEGDEQPDGRGNRRAAERSPDQMPSHVRGRGLVPAGKEQDRRRRDHAEGYK